MKKRRVLSCGLVIALAASTLMSGCGAAKNDEKSDAETGSGKITIIQQKTEI